MASTFGTRRGLVLDNINTTSQDEIDIFLTNARRDKSSLYLQTANMLWLDNRPDVAKLHFRMTSYAPSVIPTWGFLQSFGILHTYINLDWATGIINEFNNLQDQGVSKAQLMEVVMAAHVYAGPKGLESVYQATWPFLKKFQDRPEPAQFPTGWAPDSAAFKSGLDFTTPTLTDRDQTAINDWYMRTTGEIPRWVTFIGKHHPGFLKAHRLRWEGSFRGVLPKQIMPFMMIYHNIATGHKEGLREAVLLAKAWGVDKDCITLAMISAATYFSGLEGLNSAEEAVGDVL